MLALTLNINDFFFNVEANATKLNDFFLKPFGMTFGITFVGPINLTFQWQPYFGRHGFSNFDFVANFFRISSFSL